MKDIYVKFRATGQERTQIKEAASKNGLTVADYLRNLIKQDMLKKEK